MVDAEIGQKILMEILVEAEFQDRGGRAHCEQGDITTAPGCYIEMRKGMHYIDHDPNPDIRTTLVCIAALALRALSFIEEDRMKGGC